MSRRRRTRWTRREFLRYQAECLGALGLGLSASALGCSKVKARTGSNPYIQNVTPDAASVLLVAKGLPTATLRHGPAGGALGDKVPMTRTASVHALRLSELEPMTFYDYRVETPNGQVLGEAAFRTAPTAEATSFSFLALGDSGGTKDSQSPAVDALQDAARDVATKTKLTDNHEGDTRQQRRVASAMGLEPADLILHMGDLAYPAGARESYREAYFIPFSELIATTPVYPTLGNHDIMTSNGAAYLEYFSLPKNGHAKDQRSYSFDWANAHFVSLDTATEEPAEGSAQLLWLEKDLAASDRQWTVVFFHKPVFGAYKGDRESFKKALLPILERHGVDLVLSGHEHLYARFFPQSNVTWVVTGGGGQSLYPLRKDERLAYGESVFHFVRCEVEGERLTLRAIDATGEVFDQVTLQKS